MSPVQSVTYVSGPDNRKIGSAGRTRTCDPVVNSHLLYQLSYRGTRAGEPCNFQGSGALREGGFITK